MISIIWIKDLQRILSDAPVRLRHNEGKGEQIIGDLQERGRDIYSFAMDLDSMKNAIADGIP